MKPYVERLKERGMFSLEKRRLSVEYDSIFQVPKRLPLSSKTIGHETIDLSYWKVDFS